MKLTETNKAWMTQAGKDLNCAPEDLLNAIIRNIRERIEKNSKKVEDWVEVACSAQTESTEELKAWRQTRTLIEETTRATRLYLERIEAEKKKAD